jgi:hypothetical protein
MSSPYEFDNSIGEFRFTISYSKNEFPKADQRFFNFVAESLEYEAKRLRDGEYTGLDREVIK